MRWRGSSASGSRMVDIRTSAWLCLRSMRTTLTLDDDVAVRLTRLRDERKMSLRDAVNETMRAGLEKMSEPVPSARKVFATPVFHADRLSIGGLTSTAEMLSVAEGEDHR